MEYKSTYVEGKLSGKFGFEVRENKHIYFNLIIEGKPLVHTHISHGSKEIGTSLLSLMAKQLGVSLAYFCEMLDCTKSRDEYIGQLSEHPPRPSYFK